MPRIQIDGIDGLLHALSRVLATETRTVPMEALKKRLIDRLSKYPPPTGGDYVRTGDLGRGWLESGAVQVDASGTNQFADRVSVTMDNRVSYAGWVQGPEQSHVHVGRWETAEQALEAESGPFVGELGQSISNAWTSE